MKFNILHLKQLHELKQRELEDLYYKNCIENELIRHKFEEIINRRYFVLAECFIKKIEKLSSIVNNPELKKLSSQYIKSLKLPENSNNLSSITEKTDLFSSEIESERNIYDKNESFEVIDPNVYFFKPFPSNHLDFCDEEPVACSVYNSSTDKQPENPFQLEVFLIDNSKNNEGLLKNHKETCLENSKEEEISLKSFVNIKIDTKISIFQKEKQKIIKNLSKPEKFEFIPTVHIENITNNDNSALIENESFLIIINRTIFTLETEIFETFFCEILLNKEFYDTLNYNYQFDTVVPIRFYNPLFTQGQILTDKDSLALFFNNFVQDSYEEISLNIQKIWNPLNILFILNEFLVETQNFSHFSKKIGKPMGKSKKNACMNIYNRMLADVINEATCFELRKIINLP